MVVVKWLDKVEGLVDNVDNPRMRRIIQGTG